MVELALAGENVVRLKGGDPLIFGRATEEIDACRAAGVEVSVIPGISAAQGAAASLLISLTERRHARRVQFVTGHGADGKLPGDIDWARVADRAATTVLYMPRRTLDDFARKALAKGLDPATPAIAIASATLPEESHVAGIVADIGALAEDSPPARRSPSSSAGSAGGMSAQPRRRSLPPGSGIMTVHLPLHEGALSLEQWQRLEDLAKTLTPEQARWISGYFAGLDAGLLRAGGSDFAAVQAPQGRTLTILYGTETGNCRDLAKTLAASAADRGLASKLSDLSNYKVRQLKDEQDILFVVSTYGEGDPRSLRSAFSNFSKGRARRS